LTEKSENDRRLKNIRKLGTTDDRMRKEIVDIGIIHSPFKTKDETPIQGRFKPEAQGRVELYTQYEDGLKDIETFSHIILIYLFDRASEIKLVRPTFLDDNPHGIFASRHPCRPNGIGITIVRLLVDVDFSKVEEFAGKVAGLVAEITAASQEQTQGISQVNAALNQMDKATQQTAANAEELASASEEMKSQVDSLMGILNQFRFQQAMKMEYMLRTPRIAERKEPILKPENKALPKREERKNLNPEHIIPLKNDFEEF